MELPYFYGNSIFINQEKLNMLKKAFFLSLIATVPLYGQQKTKEKETQVKIYDIAELMANENTIL